MLSINIPNRCSAPSTKYKLHFDFYRVPNWGNAKSGLNYLILPVLTVCTSMVAIFFLIGTHYRAVRTGAEVAIAPLPGTLFQSEMGQITPTTLLLASPLPPQIFRPSHGPALKKSKWDILLCYEVHGWWFFFHCFPTINNT